MLKKEKRYEENDIVTVVLTGGQELLGKFVSESGDYFIIKKPLTLMYGQKISFQPFTVAGDSEGEVVLHRDKIVSILLTNSETTKAYTAPTAGVIAPEKRIDYIMPLTARTTDSTTAHSPCALGQCSAGSNNVFINNLPAFRVTDKKNTPAVLFYPPHYSIITGITKCIC